MSVFSIWTASVIWRTIVSFRYVPVTHISNPCTSPLCSSTQCRHKGDWSMFLAANFPKCSTPRVYPLLAVSPLYIFLKQLSPLHFKAYVTLSASQFPLPVVVQTKQSFRSQLSFLNGFDLCSSLFSVRPVRSTNLIRNPLFRMAWWYILLSFPPGVDGTNNTESNPPCLYQDFLLSSFCSIRSVLCHSLGLCIGRIPLSSFIIIVWNALIADFDTSYLNV